MGDPSRGSVKVGVREGGGPPPGYRWNIDLLQQATDESRSFLDDNQYAHLARQMRELATLEEPTQSETVDVRSIEDYYELRDKGGILGRINVRVFFCICKETRTIAVLGSINKKNDGATPTETKVLMRNRMRRYLASRS